MNLHYLLRAERCPRSAALRYALYSQLWDKNTYPDKPTVAALAGIVVHETVARIVRRFSEHDCTSIEDPRCSAVLKELGGYSKLFADTIADLAKALAGNPRFDIARDWSLSALEKRIPLLREYVQLQLGKISWSIRPDRKNSDAASKHDHSPVRAQLGEGVHFEVEVRYPKIKWKGIVDFLDVGNQACIIKDFKTGESSNDHILQLKVYALLWSYDRELNPKGRPASQLALCYPGAEKYVTVAPKELAELSDSLVARTIEVRASVNGPASRANVSSENCPNCDVRHLCSDYWDSSRRRKAAATNGTSIYVDDIQLELKERKGETTWSAVCLISNHFQPKTTILLRCSSPNFRCLGSLRPGMIARLAGAVVSKDDDGEYGIVNCVSNTDVIIFGA